MSIRSIRLLSAAALLAAGAANASIVGPVVWYSGSIDYVCNGQASGRDFSEPSLALCQYYMNQELQDVNNANCQLVHVDPCGFNFHGISSASAADSLPYELVTDYGNQETELRQRFRIDEFEAEMGKLIQRLQPRR